MLQSNDASGSSGPGSAHRDAALGTALPRVQRAPAPPWIPIRSLAPRHRTRILAHLIALTEHDRYLRFGYPASDEQIERYVDGLKFDRDEVFGIFNRRLTLVAMAHLAYPDRERTALARHDAAEFGVSVADRSRGRGYGARLFEHAVLHARNQGLGMMFIHALSENTPMLRIARRAGASIERSGSESDAYLKLPPETLASHVEQLFGEGAAALDYRLKQQARAVDTWIEASGAVSSGIGKVGPTFKE